MTCNLRLVICDFACRTNPKFAQSIAILYLQVMYRYLLLGYILLLSLASKAQADEEHKPTIFDSYLPLGYEIMDSVSGDVNSDNLTDYILVLQKNDEDSLSVLGESVKRPMIILTGSTSGSLVLAGRNDEIAFCKTCGGVYGDPYNGMDILSGNFSVSNYGGSNQRWSKITLFRHSKLAQKFLFIKETNEDFDVLKPDKITTRIKNGDGKTDFINYSPFDK